MRIYYVNDAQFKVLAVAIGDNDSMRCTAKIYPVVHKNISLAAGQKCPILIILSDIFLKYVGLK